MGAMKTKLIRVPRDFAEEEPAVLPFEVELAGGIERHPDGYYWVSVDGRRSFGPFATLEAAQADRDRFDEGSLEPGESLEEAEADLGIADWIDPDTGAPAEGWSTPHLVDE